MRYCGVVDGAATRIGRACFGATHECCNPHIHHACTANAPLSRSVPRRIVPYHTLPCSGVEHSTMQHSWSSTEYHVGSAAPCCSALGPCY